LLSFFLFHQEKKEEESSVIISHKKTTHTKEMSVSLCCFDCRLLAQKEASTKSAGPFVLCPPNRPDHPPVCPLLEQRKKGISSEREMERSDCVCCFLVVPPGFQSGKVCVAAATLKSKPTLFSRLRVFPNSWKGKRKKEKS